jgi:hypothetical protein
MQQTQQPVGKPATVMDLLSATEGATTPRGRSAAPEGIQIDDDGTCTRAAFAEAMGVNRSQVTRAVSAGRLSGPALRGKRLHYETAAEQWNANRDTRGGDRTGTSAGGGQPDTPEDQTLRAAKIRRELAQAEMAERRNMQEAGLLISVEAVTEALVTGARKFAERIDQLVSEADDLVELARKEDGARLVRAELKKIARSLREGIAADLTVTPETAATTDDQEFDDDD